MAQFVFLETQSDVFVTQVNITPNFFLKKTKKTVCYKWGKFAEIGLFKKIELNMPSDRVFPVLSENQTLVEIRQTEN